MNSHQQDHQVVIFIRRVEYCPQLWNGSIAGSNGAPTLCAPLRAPCNSQTIPDIYVTYVMVWRKS